VNFCAILLEKLMSAFLSKKSSGNILNNPAPLS
jgi:hypothetical protein